MLDKLFINYEETVSVILFCIGFSTMLLNKNLIKKIIGMDPVPPIRMANFLAPRGIDLSHYNYVVMDGLYYSFLYIKAGIQAASGPAGCPHSSTPEKEWTSTSISAVRTAAAP